MEAASSQVPEAILKLVEKYEFHQAAYKRGQFNQTQLRREFVDPFYAWNARFLLSILKDFEEFAAMIAQRNRCNELSPCSSTEYLSELESVEHGNIHERVQCPCCPGCSW